MSERVKIVMLVIGAALTLIGGVWLLQSAIVSRLVAWPDPNGFLVMAEAGWTAFAAVVLAILGTLGTIGGIALVLYAGTRPASENGTSDTDTYPLGLRAQLDEPLGRWLWLIKWILAIPHFVVLAFLWLAFWILTVAAFVSILGSGALSTSDFCDERWDHALELACRGLLLRNTLNGPLPAIYAWRCGLSGPSKRCVSACALAPARAGQMVAAGASALLDHWDLLRTGTERC